MSLWLTREALRNGCLTAGSVGAFLSRGALTVCFAFHGWLGLVRHFAESVVTAYLTFGTLTTGLALLDALVFSAYFSCSTLTAVTTSLLACVVFTDLTGATVCIASASILTRVVFADLTRATVRVTLALVARTLSVLAGIATLAVVRGATACFAECSYTNGAE